ncbi:MAG: ParA family protein [Gammaproteobacteria bacterium]|nr:ParA family protein [Gammaproteobacteria bacterium]
MAINVPIVATMNQKGGVGKSTITGTQAEWFSIVRKKRVCLVDLDEQCNTTKQFIGVEYINDDTEAGFQIKKHPDFSPQIGANERSSIADIFYGEAVLPYQSWITDKNAGGGLVDVLCGHPVRIEEINNALVSKEDGKVNQTAKERLKEFFEMEEVHDAYDIFLLDTGPSKNVMFRSALHAASHIVVPFEPEDKAIQGITQMLNAIKRENYSREREAQLQLAGLLPNKVRNLKLHKQYLNDLSERYEDYLFPWPCWLSLLTDFPTRDRAGAKPRSIFQLPATNTARAQATAMCIYLEKKIFGKHLGITKEIKQALNVFENGLKDLGVSASCRT